MEYKTKFKPSYNNIERYTIYAQGKINSKRYYVLSCRAFFWSLKYNLNIIDSFNSTALTRQINSTD